MQSKVAGISNSSAFDSLTGKADKEVSFYAEACSWLEEGVVFNSHKKDTRTVNLSVLLRTLAQWKTAAESKPQLLLLK